MRKVLVVIFISPLGVSFLLIKKWNTDPGVGARGTES